MTTKAYTVLEMEVMASDGKTDTSLKFTRDDAGAVEITMSGKFKTVELNPNDACILGNFLDNGFTHSGNYDPDVKRADE